MEFPFGFGQKSSLLLIFFFNGVVFTFLLLRNGILHNSRSSKWLSLLLFLCTMYIAPYMLGYANWYSSRVTREILFFVPFMQVLLIGPVVYFYTKSLLDTNFKLTKKDWIHFLPSLLYFIYSLLVFVVDKLILDEFYFYADGRDKDLANWYQAAGLVSMSFYLVLSLRYYAGYKKLVFDQVSYADAILFKWIRNFTLAFLGILVLRVLFFIINPNWGNFGSQFWHYILFSITFFYIAINGYSNAIRASVLGINKYEQPEIIENQQQSKANGGNNSLEGDITALKIKLQEAIQMQHLYKNPKLTLSDVAKELDTNTKVISSVVNSGFEMNFNDFINHYRIEAVKQKLEAGEHLKSTLLGLALDCGFNSKATFNRAFKKSTSLSPKDYIKTYQNKI